MLLISEDGLGADQFRPDTMPGLWALAERGRRAAVRPPFPATTFNGHVTLATGCWPEHHGVVANGYLRPEDRQRVPAANRVEDIQREPLWVAATRSGVRTAVFHWVGSNGPWEGVTPWRMKAFQPGVPDAEGLAFCESALADGARLVMAYLSGTDEEGHLKGPRSPEALAKLRALDAELAPWLARMQAAHPGLRVILTADHGMVPMKRRVHLPTVLDGIPVDLITHGGSAYVYLKQPRRPGPRPGAAPEGGPASLAPGAGAHSLPPGRQSRGWGTSWSWRPSAPGSPRPAAAARMNPSATAAPGPTPTPRSPRPCGPGWWCWARAEAPWRMSPPGTSPPRPPRGWASSGPRLRMGSPCRR